MTPRKAGGTKARDILEDSSAPESRKYLVRIRTTNAEYEGKFYSPYPDRRLAEVLTRMEQFISLKEAREIVSGDTFPFMVIGKTSIETIKVIKEWT